MQTTLDISDSVLRQAKNTALRESITLEALAEEGLRLAIERRRQTRPVKFNPHVVTGKGAAPDLSGRKLTESLYKNEADRILKPL